MTAPGRRQTVCLVNPFEHGGGAEYQLSLLAQELIRRPDCSVTYLTHFVHEAQARDYAITRIGGGGPIPRLGYLMEGRELYRTLAAIKPDVIYQRVACGYTGVCAFYAQRQKIPMVWHVSHDTDLTSEWLDGGRNVLRNWLEKRAVGYGARHASDIVVQTRSQAQLLQAHYAREASLIVPNFHPPAAEVCDKSGPVTVLWIANLKSWKRPELFVRLARALRGLAGVRFIMVGASSGAANRNWEESLLRDVRALPNLKYVGSKSQAEVAQLLASSHIFVNTSLHEGFPNTFIQAWYRGVAVVSLGVDPDGVLQGMDAGLAARDEADLAAKVRSLIEDPSRRELLTQRALVHAATHHSLDNARRLADFLLSDARGGLRATPPQPAPPGRSQRPSNGRPVA